jgi:alkylhydroperoxidase family enzyme
MARVPYVEREKAAEPEQRAYDALQKATGRVLNFFKLMANLPGSLPRFLEWYRTTREGGPLELGLRQLAYVRVAQLNRCEY